MDARSFRAVGLFVGLLFSLGAGSQTRNFIVQTGDPRHAAAFAQQAERLRRELAIAWLGHELPDWSYPCPITATVGPHLGAGGATSFVFDQGEVFGWRMTIQGSYERILDSVLPHEITHMIFASHFRRPLPRWADEGGATSIEHESEKTKHRQMLVQFLRSHRGIPFNQMFAMTEYPADIMPLYAQGYAVAEYLIQQGGRRKYIDFLADGLAQGRWAESLQKHYGIQDLGILQTQWVAWVAQGFPALKPAPDRVLPAGGRGPNEALATVNPAPVSSHPTPPNGNGSPSSPNMLASSSPGSRSSSAHGNPEFSPGDIVLGPTTEKSSSPSERAGFSSPTGNGKTSHPGESSPRKGGQPSTDSEGTTPSEWTVAADSPAAYRPGSIGRPGIVWTRPLAPLPAEPRTESTLAATTPPGPMPLADAPPAEASSKASPQVGADRLAQSDRNPAPATPGRIGPDGWFTAGTRPAYAPGSIGKLYSGSRGSEGIGSPGAVSNQLTRPQMPDSSSRVLLQWPTTTPRTLQNQGFP